MQVSLKLRGPDAFLVKPVTPSALPGWLEQHEDEIFHGGPAFASTAPPQAAAAPPSIALVTASGFLQALVHDTLDEAGLPSGFWGSAVRTMEEVRDVDVRLLLIDADLPDMRGDMLCMAMSEAPVGKGIGLVLVDRNPEGDLDRRAREVGAGRFLERPLSPDGLLDWVQDEVPALIGEPVTLRRPRPGDRLRSRRYRFDMDEITVLLYHLETETSVEARLEAAYLLGRAGPEVAAEGLEVAARKDPDPEVRAEAVAALAGLASDRGLAAAAQFCSDPHPFVRRRAFEALGDTGDKRVVAPLSRYLAEDDPVPVVAALRALVRVGDPKAAPAVEVLCASKDATIKANASWALRELRGDAR